jgi:hypothetical protein
VKASICDFCGAVIPTDDKAAMVYRLETLAADGYEAKTAQEAKLLFSADDLCTDCAARCAKALHAVKRESRKATEKREKREGQS